jgi:hypothetical protein
VNGNQPFIIGNEAGVCEEDFSATVTYSTSGT